MAVKRYALAATLSLLVGGAVQAAAVDLDNGPPVHTQRMGVAATGPGSGTAELSVAMSELPEPEVFAMMLVGLILIGYRASRDSSEKFK